jgi:hypothetical protein
MSTTKFDNITDLSDYFQGQIISLVDYSTALKQQSDSHHDCLVHVQLKAPIQQARIEGLVRSISILTRQLFEHLDKNKTHDVRVTLTVTLTLTEKCSNYFWARKVGGWLDLWV